MNQLTEEVRDTFRTVADRAPVPVFDELAFRAGVRRARRRRAGRAAVGLGAAAAVVTGALLVVPPLLDQEAAQQPQVAAGSPEVQPEALPIPLYYVAGTRLTAVTPDGEVHDLGRAEEVVGFTAEGVVAAGPDSDLVWIGSSTSGEGDDSYTFERGAGPVRLPETGPVQGAALSSDTRYLAWIGTDDVVTTWDLKADALVQEVAVGPDAVLTSVSDRGALVSQDGDLGLFGPVGWMAVPTEGDGYGALSDTAGDLVTVADRDGTTRVYDVTPDDGRAELVDSVPGAGRLAPYAKGIVTVSTSANGERTEALLFMADDEERRLDGLEGIPQTAGWLDEDHVLVATAEAGGTSVFLCPVAEQGCTRVAFSEADVRLAG